MEKDYLKLEIETDNKVSSKLITDLYNEALTTCTTITEFTEVFNRYFKTGIESSYIWISNYSNVRLAIIYL